MKSHRSVSGEHLFESFDFVVAAVNLAGIGAGARASRPLLLQYPSNSRTGSWLDQATETAFCQQGGHRYG